MKKITLFALLLLATCFSKCSRPIANDGKNESTDSLSTQPSTPMKNLISIVEIPVTDLNRAMSFYQTILSITIEKVEMGGVQMGVLPSDGEHVNVVLAMGSDYKPTTSGTLIYLQAGDNLQIILDKIESSGGQVVLPKTEISPEMGFFALFIDTEGNKIGLHSPR